MRTWTFKGGVHPLKKTEHGKALSHKEELRIMPPSSLMAYPLSQHIGAPATPVVNVGDDVKIGQRIAVAGGFVSADIYASISGVVEAITLHSDGAGEMKPCILIRNDYMDRVDENIRPLPPIEELSPEQILQAVRDAGLTGMGGAAFPTHVKLSIPVGKKAELLIVNGAECEPYLTADHWLMKTQAEELALGAAAAMKAIGAKRCCIAIESNKADAAKCVKEAIAAYKNVDIKLLGVKYPQGAEKQLVYAVTGKEIPSGSLPIDVGAVVMNAGTAAALGVKLKTGMPLIQRIITVSGEGINKPSNLVVRLGTPFRDVIEFSGGLKDNVTKLIAGGPMMGKTIPSADGTVVKGTSGLVALTEEQTGFSSPNPCINCGRCIRVCPMRIQPLRICTAVEIKNYDMASKFGAMDCIECGACTYVCPAKRLITQSCRMAKIEIRKQNENGRKEK